MKETKKPFDKCPVCGGQLKEKKVEKLLQGDVDIAVIKVRAEVCLHCGERLYSQETVKRFEEIRKKLKQNKVTDFQPIGRTFQVPAYS